MSDDIDPRTTTMSKLDLQMENAKLYNEAETLAEALEDLIDVAEELPELRKFKAFDDAEITLREWREAYG